MQDTISKNIAFAKIASYPKLIRYSNKFNSLSKNESSKIDFIIGIAIVITATIITCVTPTAYLPEVDFLKEVIAVPIIPQNPIK